MNLARISAAWLLAATVHAVGSAATVTGLAALPIWPANAQATGSLSPLAGVLNGAMAAYDTGDYRRARFAFRGLADQGSAIAETMLGVIYAHGQGVSADPATAAGYWLRAASRGYAPAQLAFAHALADGIGVARDPGMAWMWASLAARGGDAAVARQAAALAARLRRGFTAEEAVRMARRLTEWRPWVAAD